MCFFVDYRASYLNTLAMCLMNCETMGRFFLILWSDIPPFSLLTSDVITGMSVTQFLAVGYIADLNSQLDAGTAEAAPRETRVVFNWV